MRTYLTLILSFLFLVVHAQDDWREGAREILKAAAHDDDWLMFEAMEKLPGLTEKLTRYCKEQDTDPAFAHWVMVTLAQQGGAVPPSIKEAMDRPIEHTEHQLAFLLEMGEAYAFSDSAGLQNPYYDQALALLHHHQLAESSWMVKTLLDYASFHSGPTFRRLDSALALSEKLFGKASTSYVRSLEGMSNAYYQTGDLKRTSEWDLRLERARRTISGVSRPVRYLFEYPPPPTDEFEGPAGDLLLLAGLYQHIHRQCGDFMAAELYSKALHLVDSTPSRLAATAAYHAGAAYLEAGMPRRAVPLLEQAFRQLQSLHKEWEMASIRSYNAYALAGVAYYELGRYEKAYRSFAELDGLLMKAGMGEKEFRYNSLHNLILTSEKLESAEKVKRHTQQFLELKGQSVAEENPERLRKYGQANAAVGNQELGYELLREAYDEYWSLVAFKQMREEADPYAEEEEFETMGEEDLRIHIGADEVFYEVGKKPVSDDYLPFLKDLALSAYANGRDEEARNYLLEYINEYYMAVEWRHETTGLGNDLAEIYRLKQDLFPMYELFQNMVIREKGVSEAQLMENRKMAFNHILNTKSNVQFEYRHMRQTIANTEDPELLGLYQAYLDKRQAFIEAGKDGGDVYAIKTELNQLRNELSFRSAAFKTPQKQFAFWHDVKNALQKKEAAIEIKRISRHDGKTFTNEVIYLAYILTYQAKYPELVVFSDGRFMEQGAIRRLTNLMKYKQEDKQSYAVYWEPLEPYLKGVKRVYLSADGVYNQLNVASLKNPGTDRYVMDEVDVFNLISTKELSTAKDIKTEVEKATLIGRPTYHIEDWLPEEVTDDTDNEHALSRAQIASGMIADLPETEKEIRYIDRVLGQAGLATTVHLGDESTEARFRESKSDILHVATHGFWFEENNASEADAMLNSGLLFAGVKNHATANSPTHNDGILTAYEIQGLSLDGTDLVVLSACETALGKVEVGEGVFGLQRALKIAGADHLIMSLWKVDDRATQELFSAFYHYWIDQKMDLHDAFPLAQKAIREKYSHPYYWGAFVLID